MPGMSSMPSLQSLVHVPFNGFAESPLHKPVSLLADDATQDAMAAYKKLEDAAAAKAAAAGGSDDTELFTDDAWQWDAERARQLYAPSIGQLTLLCAAARLVGWVRSRRAADAPPDEKADAPGAEAARAASSPRCTKCACPARSSRPGCCS